MALETSLRKLDALGYDINNLAKTSKFTELMNKLYVERATADEWQVTTLVQAASLLAANIVGTGAVVLREIDAERFNAIVEQVTYLYTLIAHTMLLSDYDNVEKVVDHVLQLHTELNKNDHQ